jgi:hypothetical protein
MPFLHTWHKGGEYINIKIIMTDAGGKIAKKGNLPLSVGVGSDFGPTI